MEKKVLQPVWNLEEGRGGEESGEGSECGSECGSIWDGIYMWNPSKCGNRDCAIRKKKKGPEKIVFLVLFPERGMPLFCKRKGLFCKKDSSFL